MKKFIAILFLGLFSACTFQTKFGECVGFANQSNKRPNLQYEVSVANIIWTVVASESVIVPIVWGLTCVQCPVGEKK